MFLCHQSLQQTQCLLRPGMLKNNRDWSVVRKTRCSSSSAHLNKDRHKRRAYRDGDLERDFCSQTGLNFPWGRSAKGRAAWIIPRNCSILEDVFFFFPQPVIQESSRPMIVHTRAHRYRAVMLHEEAGTQLPTVGTSKVWVSTIKNLNFFPTECIRSLSGALFCPQSSGGKPVSSHTNMNLSVGSRSYSMTEPLVRLWNLSIKQALERLWCSQVPHKFITSTSSRANL